MIECRQLKKYYTNSKITTEVLKEIDLKISAGDFCIITGPSGSGKTTLLYTLSGLEKPTSGEVLLLDKNILEYKASEVAELRKNKIGFVFQFYNLMANLNIFDNIKLASVISGKVDEAEIKYFIDLVGLSGFEKYYPNEISGGMQQKTAICRSIINHPDLIFADEPTGNLDQKSGKEIMELFQLLNKQYKKTIIMVTHNEEHLAYATRHIRLVDGKVIKDDIIST